VFNKPYGCQDGAPGGAVVMYVERGPLLGPDGIASVDWVFAGTGRLQRRVLPGPDGALVPLAAPLLAQAQLSPFQDTTIDDGCDPVWTPEGLVRCIPESVVVPRSAGLFADAACERVAYSCSTRYGCAGALIASGVSDVDGVRQVDSISVAREVGALFSRNGDACTPLPQAPDPGWYAAGPTPEPWSRFPAIAERNGWPKAAP
jgi:hypothetical protein